MVLSFGRHSDSSACDNDGNDRIDSFDCNCDLSSYRELDCVADNVESHLAHATAIANWKFLYTIMHSCV